VNDPENARCRANHREIAHAPHQQRFPIGETFQVLHRKPTRLGVGTQYPRHGIGQKPADAVQKSLLMAIARHISKPIIRHFQLRQGTLHDKDAAGILDLVDIARHPPGERSQRGILVSDDTGIAQLAAKVVEVFGHVLIQQGMISDDTLLDQNRASGDRPCR